MMDFKEDLVVVPVGPKNFNKMFKNGFWSAIEISEARLPYLQYIACYQLAPVSAITYFARLDKAKITPNQKESHKYDLFFSDISKLSKSIPTGVRQFGQGRRYTTLQRLLISKTIDDVFDFDSNRETTQANLGDILHAKNYDNTASDSWIYKQTEEYLIRLILGGIFQVTYGDLYSHTGVNSHDQSARNEFNNLLGIISTQHHYKGLPLLSAIVVNKNTNMPGFGFFNVARDLNTAYAQLDDETIYKQEISNIRRSLEAYKRFFLPNKPTYLLTWNPSKSDWENFQEDWQSFRDGKRPRFEWSCGNTQRIQIGDRVFIMRLGWRENITGILASGWVTRKPEESPHWADEERTALYIEFEPDVLLDPEIDVLLDPILVSGEYNWYPQRSGVTIPYDIAAHLEQVWQKHIANINQIPSSETVNDIATRTYLEGSRKIVNSYLYERDPEARIACIRNFGNSCAVCGFEFGEEYGKIGEGYIHVHHLTPISSYDAEHEIDPIRDLRPVCPNCHVMLHQRNPPYSIAELQTIRQNAAKQRESSSQTKP